MSDGNLFNTYEFNIDVTNSAPKFINGGQPRDVSVKLGETFEYEVKNVVDDEFNDLTIESVQKPSFSSLKGFKYVFKPTLPT